jgi:hypothetical protein
LPQLIVRFGLPRHNREFRGVTEQTALTVDSKWLFERVKVRSTGPLECQVHRRVRVERSAQPFGARHLHSGLEPESPSASADAILQK